MVRETRKIIPKQRDKNLFVFFEGRITLSHGFFLTRSIVPAKAITRTVLIMVRGVRGIDKKENKYIKSAVAAMPEPAAITAISGKQSLEAKTGQIIKKEGRKMISKNQRKKERASTCQNIAELAAIIKSRKSNPSKLFIPIFYYL